MNHSRCAALDRKLIAAGDKAADVIIIDPGTPPCGLTPGSASVCMNLRGPIGWPPSRSCRPPGWVSAPLTLSGTWPGSWRWRRLRRRRPSRASPCLPAPPWRRRGEHGRIVALPAASAQPSLSIKWHWAGAMTVAMDSGGGSARQTEGRRGGVRRRNATAGTALLPSPLPLVAGLGSSGGDGDTAAATALWHHRELRESSQSRPRPSRTRLHAAQGAGAGGRRRRRYCTSPPPLVPHGRHCLSGTATPTVRMRRPTSHPEPRVEVDDAAATVWVWGGWCGAAAPSFSAAPPLAAPPPCVHTRVCPQQQQPLYPILDKLSREQRSLASLPAPVGALYRGAVEHERARHIITESQRSHAPVRGSMRPCAGLRRT